MKILLPARRVASIRFRAFMFFYKTLKSHNLKIKNFSSHSLSKSFDLEIFNRSAESAELAIVKPSQLFNHCNPAIIRRYLGISHKELPDTYNVLSS